MVNFKKLSIVTVCAAAIGLAGCDMTQTDATVTAVQNYTRLACSFVPTATTVSAILTKVDPTASATNAVATQVANAICSQVGKKDSAKRGASRPTVEGVAIEGDYVTPEEKVSK